MKIFIHKGCLLLEPENQADTFYMEVLEAGLTKENIKHETNRQWTIEGIQILCEVNEEHENVN